MARQTTISNIWTLCLVIPVCTTLLFAGTQIPGAAASAAAGNIKSLSLEELSQIEVISPAKEPRQAMAVPMAIHVITGDEIRRSGATSIPEALRLAPGVEVAR